MRYSYKPITGKPRQDGTCALYMRIIINRRKKEIPLDIAWPKNKFKHGKCKPRKKDDPDVEDYNMIIQSVAARCNEIFKYYRLTNQALSIEHFMKDFNRQVSRDSFIRYYELRMDERWRAQEISDGTRKNHQTTLNKLIDWKGEIMFSDLDNRWAEAFDNWLRIHESNGVNARWSHHKHVRSYLRQADKDNIKYDDPYRHFKPATARGEWRALKIDELKKLVELYRKEELKPLYQVVLRRFLFSCATGLRISDLKRLTKANFRDGEMSLKPYKTRRFDKNLTSLPLNTLAQELLQDEIIERRHPDKLFHEPSDQYSNKALKEIAEIAKLHRRLHHHVGRSTFATLYEEAGGSESRLMEYMGLSKRETLSKYLHINYSGIKKDIDNLDELL